MQAYGRDGVRALQNASPKGGDGIQQIEHAQLVSLRFLALFLYLVC